MSFDETASRGLGTHHGPRISWQPGRGCCCLSHSSVMVAHKLGMYSWEPPESVSPCGDPVQKGMDTFLGIICPVASSPEQGVRIINHPRGGFLFALDTAFAKDDSPAESRFGYGLDTISSLVLPDFEELQRYRPTASLEIYLPSNFRPQSCIRRIPALGRPHTGQHQVHTLTFRRPSTPKQFECYPQTLGHPQLSKYTHGG